MGEFKAYAAGSNMAYISSTGTTWTRESARQGAYNSNRFYGVAMFAGIGAFNPKGKTITNIRLTFDFNRAGANAVKTLKMFRSGQTTITGTGPSMLGASIGSLTGVFYENTHTFDFNANNQPFFFNAILNHLQLGGTGLAFYSAESKQADVAWSINYLSIAAVTITITWLDDFVWYNRGGEWIRCTVMVNKGGSWVRCRARYNKNGVWVT